MKMNYASATDTANFDLYLDNEILKDNVSLSKTGDGWDNYVNASVGGIELPEGEHVLRFVINKDGGFNFKSFSLGSYIQVQVPDLIEGSLTNQTIDITLVDGTFAASLDASQFTLSGPLAQTPLKVERVSDTQAKVTFIGEAPQDFDSDQTVQLHVDASQINDEGYTLNANIHVKAVDDDESIIAFAPFNDASHDAMTVAITGGTIDPQITVEDIELSDSLRNYIEVTDVQLGTDGNLAVLYKRNKINYVDIAGTVIIKSSGYSDGIMDLEGDVTLIASPEGPTPIEISSQEMGTLSLANAYNSNGSLADASGGEFENYYIHIQEAGDYILSFDITNNEETSGSLSINGGLGINSTNNLASISFGKYWNNTNVSYKTMIHYDEAGYNTLQLRANVAMKLTNAKLSMKPAATPLNENTTITVASLVDGSDDKLWAIENGNAIGYTGTGAYQDYFVDVFKAGKYSFKVNYATEGNDSVVELISVVNGKETSLGTIDLASTGAWSTFKSSSTITVQLPAGEQILRLKVANGGFNSNALIFEKLPTVTPEIIGTNAKVYANTDESVASILGLKVMLGDEDITNSAVIETNYDATQAGQYTVTVTALDSDGNAITKEFMIQVEAVPTMEVSTDAIKVNETFDPLTNIKVMDENGNDITDQVQIEVISNDVDTTQAGQYTVVYEVTFANGDKATYTREVVVETVDQPDIPDQPDQPDQPIDPNKPDQPVDPDTPDQPTTPDQPVVTPQPDDRDDNHHVTVIVPDQVIKTGDSINTGYFIAGGCIALLAVIVLISKKRKRHS